jgi:archaemetzincin
MGLGYLPGKACLISTARLSKKNLYNQLLKVCLHEIGHTQGLPHCDKKYCFMRDAKGKNHNNEETQYCKDCSLFLNKRFS